MNISLHAAGNKRQKKGSNASLSFGLNSRQEKNTNPSNNNNVFGDDSDSSDNKSDDDGATQTISRREVVNKQIAREQAARRRRAQADLASVKDKSVYDYDGAYDSFQTGMDTTKKEEDNKDPEKKSKYIGDLLKAAKVRDRERDAIFERRNAREQAEEDAKEDYKGKEKFVTKSYKRKLQERKQWEAEQKQKEREEAANDVTKKSAGAAFAGFYGNLNRSAMMEQKKKESDDDEASPNANVDQNEEGDKGGNKDIKPPDEDDFDPRQGLFGGFERSANDTKIDGSRNNSTEPVEDEYDDKVAPPPKLSIRELREKKVAEASKRYLKRKQALQLEQ
jgi:coiled-coil domain-containing protein 55